MSTPLPIYYDPRQHTDANVSTSPSAGKPAQVIARWERSHIPTSRMPVTPATPEQFALAHDRGFVDGILACTHANGFGNRSREVAATLPWTTGSLVSAARHVARHGGVAVSPTSGFHHARHRSAGGFCTFNGLMVAVRVLQLDGLARKIGILDIDAHYQAGADPFIDDPLGGVLTREQLRLRDRIVFQHFARAGIPLAWNLAGGYTRDAAGTIEPVLQIHDATLEECHAAYSQSTPSA